MSFFKKNPNSAFGQDQGRSFQGKSLNGSPIKSKTVTRFPSAPEVTGNT